MTGFEPRRIVDMDKTCKPTVAGILDIVSGAVGLIAVIGLIIAIGVVFILFIIII